MILQVAAVAGGLAGIYYGYGIESGIPDEWIAQIPGKNGLRGYVINLKTRKNKMGN